MPNERSRERKHPRISMDACEARRGIVSFESKYASKARRLGLTLEDNVVDCHVVSVKMDRK
eukprot:scaffold3484_cov681-Pavlova_lutheri.AAC.1